MLLSVPSTVPVPPSALPGPVRPLGAARPPGTPLGRGLVTGGAVRAARTTAPGTWPDPVEQGPAAGWRMGRGPAVVPRSVKR